MTLTEAGAQVQAAGRLRVTSTEGWTAGRAREGGGSGQACVVREQPEQKKDEQKERHHPTRLQANSMAPPPHQDALGRIWGGSYSPVGRRAGGEEEGTDGVSNTRRASLLREAPSAGMFCPKPSLGSLLLLRQASTQRSPPVTPLSGSTCVPDPHPPPAP